jgi:hypothetical protein
MDRAEHPPNLSTTKNETQASSPGYWFRHRSEVPAVGAQKRGRKAQDYFRPFTAPARPHSTPPGAGRKSHRVNKFGRRLTSGGHFERDVEISKRFQSAGKGEAKAGQSVSKQRSLARFPKPVLGTFDPNLTFEFLQVFWGCCFER